MCVIIDANALGLVFAQPPEPDFVALVNWLFDPKADGGLAYGGQLFTEIERVARASRAIARLNSAGRAFRVPDSAISAEEQRLPRARLRSNDPHVIALARVSGARTLCSGDVPLQADFGDAQIVNRPRGCVYWPHGWPKRRKAHARLLRHTSSCPRKPSKKT